MPPNDPQKGETWRNRHAHYRLCILRRFRRRGCAVVAYRYEPGQGVSTEERTWELRDRRCEYAKPRGRYYTLQGFVQHNEYVSGASND